MINAGLGTGTVSSVAFVLNRLTDFSMGFFVFLTNVFFFVLQVIVDSKDLVKKAFRQLPICFVFGMIFDIALWVSGHIVAQNYWQQLLMAFFGSILTGLGIASMVFARLVGYFAARRLCACHYEPLGRILWDTTYER